MGHASTRPVHKSDFLVHDWNLQDEHIEQALQQCKEDKMRVHKTKITTRESMLLFLYGKNLLDVNRSMRKCEIKQLTTNEYIQERLQRIVEIGETSHNHATAFRDFLLTHPEWDKEVSFVVFRDHPLLSNKKVYVERIQKSGLCHIHGAAAYSHYYFSMHQDEPMGMVDASAYLRKNVHAKALKAHIFQNAGGNSLETLRILLGSETHKDFEKPDIKSPQIPYLMEEYGCALVSCFEVWDCFFNSEISIHLGKPQGEMRGHHSLLLVGYRYLQGGDIRYLLQNWWEKKSFVEVDADYMRHCGSVVTFCTSPNLPVPSKFTTNPHAHVESAHDSAEELVET